MSFIFQIQKVIVLLVMVTMFPAAHIMENAKLERVAAVMTTSVMGIYFVEHIIAGGSMETQLQAWIAVSVNITKELIT